MKVYIIHGWDGNPNEPMLKWLRTSLEARDYEVTAPAMPDPEAPEIKAWVRKLMQVIVPTKDTVIVGHSVGCQAILRYLEALPREKKIKRLVLIAPWMRLNEKLLEKEGEEIATIARPWMETQIDFEKAREHAPKIVAIFSDNDPYATLDQRAVFEKELGAKIIVEKKKGHFTAADGVRVLPSALGAVTEL